MTRHMICFLAIEVELRQYMNLENMAGKMNKRSMEDAVMASEDVRFKWWLLSEDFDEDIGGKLLRSIVEFYVQIRGYSFTASFLERYKQSSHKLLQKSKPLRTKLISIES